MKKFTVGVVVGRFQVHKLHEGHTGLINFALNLSDHLIVLVGTAPLKNSTANPLDFRSREQMIRSAFWPQRKRLTIEYIDDTGDNESWASALDKKVRDLTGAQDDVAMFGGRDSFLPHYIDGKGKHTTVEFEDQQVTSGTEIRKEIAQSDSRDSEDWRAALIYASQDRFPTSFQCVDVAVLKYMPLPDGGLDRVKYVPTEILLGRKKNDKLLRFFGGFVDPTDPSLEAAAVREVHEEANHISVGGAVDAKYVGSANVDDWRYAREPDGIKTALFTVAFEFGNPKPTDDLKGGEVRWVRIADLKPTMIVPQHRHLLDMLLTKGI